VIAHRKASTCSQTQKNTYTFTNTKHPSPEWDSNPRSRPPSERRESTLPLGYRDRLRNFRYKYNIQDSKMYIPGDLITLFILSFIPCDKALENLNFLKYHIVTCRPISRQRPKYAHATIEPLLQEGFSIWFSYIHC
jgi:hypothetical protein